MKHLSKIAMLISALVAGGAYAQAPKFSDNVIRIGVLNDRAGPYADLSGEGSAVAARMAVGGMFPGWGLLAAPLIEAVLWPLVVWLLLAPQRRAPDPDENRPL